MAYLSKEQYEYRRESAAIRNARNERIAIENGTGYYEYFDNSELDESGEPTQEQIDELKNFLSDNYNYITE